MLHNESSVTPERLPCEARVRFEAGHRLAGLTVSRVRHGEGDEVLYHFDHDLVASHLRLAVVEGGEVPSLAGVFPAAGLEEAEMRDRFGLRFQKDPPTPPIPEARRLTLPGPLPLALEVAAGRVVRAELAPLFGRRDLERYVLSRSPADALLFAVRTCGLCSFGHGLAFCLGVEDLLGVAVPPRAEALRVLWAELHRVGSHLFWMAGLARFLGHERLFAQCLRVRELALSALEATSGDRIIASAAIVGGVRRDIDAGYASWAVQQVAVIERGLRDMEKPLLDDYVVALRTRGVGLLTREQARVLGAVGPTLRASGWAIDVRSQAPAGYGRLDFTPCVETEGDVYSRLRVRLREALVSCDLARQCLYGLPQGEVAAPVPSGQLDGEAWVRVEQPRGEQFVYLRSEGAENLAQVRIRTATRANAAPLLAMLPGLDTQDAALAALSIDPCASCAGL